MIGVGRWWEIKKEYATSGRDWDDLRRLGLFEVGLKVIWIL